MRRLEQTEKNKNAFVDKIEPYTQNEHHVMDLQSAAFCI